MSAAEVEQRRIVASFPGKFSFACTYGSGAFAQSGNAASESTMLDFIFAVDDAAAWHDANLKRHGWHYSAQIRALNSGNAIRRLSRNGAAIFYNSHVKHEGRLIKYGVIQTNDIIEDFNTWESLYTAGRLQKPVRVLACDPRVRVAYDQNLASALRAAVTILQGSPTADTTRAGLPSFTARDIFVAVAQLSYSGDLRMVVGENKNKVQNIVDAQLDAFYDLYAPHFVSASIFEDGDRLVCDVAGKRNWGNWPPAHLARAHQADCGGDLRHALAALDAAGAADGPTPPTVPRTAMHPLEQAISSVVRGTSTKQMAVGLLGSNPIKTLTYVGEKLSKMLQGMKQKESTRIPPRARTAEEEKKRP